MTPTEAPPAPAPSSPCACGGAIKDGAHGTHSCTPIQRNEKGEIVVPLPGAPSSPEPRPPDGIDGRWQRTMACGTCGHVVTEAQCQCCGSYSVHPLPAPPPVPCNTTGYGYAPSYRQMRAILDEVRRLRAPPPGMAEFEQLVDYAIDAAWTAGQDGRYSRDVPEAAEGRTALLSAYRAQSAALSAATRRVEEAERWLADERYEGQRDRDAAHRMLAEAKDRAEAAESRAAEAERRVHRLLAVVQAAEFLDAFVDFNESNLDGDGNWVSGPPDDPLPMDRAWLALGSALRALASASPGAAPEKRNEEERHGA